MAILACIGFSINLGNYVWELGTDYFIKHGGQISVQAPDQNVTQYSAIANGSLESLTLQYYLNERRGMSVSPGGEWSYSGNWFQSGGEYKFNFNGNLGSIIVIALTKATPFAGERSMLSARLSPNCPRLPNSWQTPTLPHPTLSRKPSPMPRTA